MSAMSKIASLIAQLILAIFLILYGIHLWIIDYGLKDVPFAEYENLTDCINKNLDKRNPEQYCRKIREKVERARRRKYGNV